MSKALIPRQYDCITSSVAKNLASRSSGRATREISCAFGLTVDSGVIDISSKIVSRDEMSLQTIVL